MALGPGVDSAITVIFNISSSVIHFFFWTQVSSIIDIMAYPPPNVKRPILKKVTNNSIIAAIISPRTYRFLLL